jgi:hypothetical protein
MISESLAGKYVISFKNYEHTNAKYFGLNAGLQCNNCRLSDQNRYDVFIFNWISLPEVFRVVKIWRDKYPNDNMFGENVKVEYISMNKIRKLNEREK